ncbi:hypothetical protein LY76DRAFT_597739 [Colletotrichum caudatum]|nr:hypothetical protein LY76DRAFT_597739 [Colletotrichum caudatum]
MPSEPWPLAPREPKKPPTGCATTRSSYLFRGRTLGEIISCSPSPKVTWRPSDQLIMKSFLAFYRLSIPAIRSMAAAPTTVKSRQRILDESSSDSKTCPTLVELAAKLNIEVASLSNEEWIAIRKKMSSSMIHTLIKAINKGILHPDFDADIGVPTLNWPNDVRDAWTHKEWWGDEEARLPTPSPQTSLPPSPQTSDVTSSSCTASVPNRHNRSPSSSMSRPASHLSLRLPPDRLCSPRLISTPPSIPLPSQPRKQPPPQLSTIISAAKHLRQATAQHLSSIIAEGDAWQATLPTLPSAVLGPSCQARQSALRAILDIDLFMDELLPLSRPLPRPDMTTVDSGPFPPLVPGLLDLKMTRHMARVTRDGAAQDLRDAFEAASRCSKAGGMTRTWARMGLTDGFSGLRVDDCS